MARWNFSEAVIATFPAGAGTGAPGARAWSQHLKILRDTGLVSARRRGRMVLYQRTAAATALLEAVPSSEQTG